jgi:hypothetical protein
MTSQERKSLQIGDKVAFEDSHIGVVSKLSKTCVEITWKNTLSHDEFVLTHGDLLSRSYRLIARHQQNSIGLEELI